MNIKAVSLKVLLFVFTFSVLTGCEHSKLRNEIETNDAEINETISTYAETSYPQIRTVETVNRNWIASEEIKIEEPIPAKLQKVIPLSSGIPLTLDEIAARISAKTGIAVRLEPDLYPETESTTTSTSLDSTGASIPVEGSEAVSVDLPKITYQHTGSIHSFLDDVAARFGIVWQYENSQIIFSRFMTKVFSVEMLDGVTTFNASVGGSSSASTESLGTVDSTGASLTDGGGSSGSQSTVSQTTTLSNSSQRWNDLIEAIEGLLTEDGVMNAMRTTGTVIVTDTPNVVSRVEQLIGHENNIVTQQVALHIHVLTATLENSSEGGVNWEAVFNNGDLAANLVTPLLGTTTGSLSLSLIRPTSDFNNTNAIVKALLSQSNVSTLTSATTITVNNQPVPVQVTNTNGFLRSVSNVVTGTTGVSETTLEPGQITSGFIMTATPRILKDDRILIRLAANISSLLRFQEQSSGNATIQIPETDERAFLQEVIMRSGQTLVVAGFEQSSNNLSDQGLGLSKNWLAGSQEISKGKSQIIIVVSPVLVGDSHNG